MSDPRTTPQHGYVTYAPAAPGGPVRRLSYGLASATMVETGAGWRRVETLLPGQEVYTLAGTAAVLRRIERRRYLADVARAWPDGLILVPGGAFGNCETLYLLPDQLVALPGVPGAGPEGLIRAETLEGRAGIHRALPVDGVDVFRLRFDEDAVVRANTGVMIHCPPAWPPVASRGPGAVAGCGLRILEDAEAARRLEARWPLDPDAGGGVAWRSLRSAT